MSRRLYHISDQPNIALFEPRTGGHGFEHEAVVWAIDEAHLPNYLLPRDCPRVTFFANDDSDPADVERLLGGTSAKRVIAIESIWLPRIRDERLYRYEFDMQGFASADGTAGYYVSREAVTVVAETEITDIISELLTHNVELRVMSSLWKLREAVIHSTLGFSVIRMRNAQPPAEGYDAYHPLPQRAVS
jgi:hypothetical protein